MSVSIQTSYIERIKLFLFAPYNKHLVLENHDLGRCVQTSLRSVCTHDLGQNSPIHTSSSVNSGAPAAEGRQAEPHTHIRKLKGTHELIFSCVSWLAVLLVGAYARRRRRRRRRWWSRATWRPQLTRKPKRHVNPWFKASFGHPCCSQLTPVKTRNPLTSIT